MKIAAFNSKTNEIKNVETEDAEIIHLIQNGLGSIRKAADRIAEKEQNNPGWLREFKQRNPKLNPIVLDRFYHIGRYQLPVEYLHLSQSHFNKIRLMTADVREQVMSKMIKVVQPDGTIYEAPFEDLEPGQISLAVCQTGQVEEGRQRAILKDRAATVALSRVSSAEISGPRVECEKGNVLVYDKDGKLVIRISHREIAKLAAMTAT